MLESFQTRDRRRGPPQPQHLDGRKGVSFFSMFQAQRQVQPASGKDLPLSHMISLPDSRCMCPAENPGCRDQPFTILYRDMDVVSGRSVPADIFQMQATTRYPGAYYIFQIKSGNEGREFYMRVRGVAEWWSPSSTSCSVVQPGVCFQKQARVQFGGVGVEAGGESGWESGLHCPGSSHFLSGLENIAPPL